MEAKKVCNDFGDTHWYNEYGAFHRENDLPAVELANGLKTWWINGKRHRDNDMPAIIEGLNGDKAWYICGKLHRDKNRPAVEFGNGDRYKEWWLNGINITSFRNKYLEARQLRAQKKIYFWIIKIIYRPGSESAKRLAANSWKNGFNS